MREEIYPIGTELYCPVCKVVFAILQVERKTGDRLKAEDFKRPDGTSPTAHTKINTCECDIGPLIRKPDKMILTMNGVVLQESTQ